MHAISGHPHIPATARGSRFYRALALLIPIPMPTYRVWGMYTLNLQGRMQVRDVVLDREVCSGLVAGG